MRRADIDGLRAVAVLSTIAFHLGLSRHGYLGVDVFFVISGYLIIGLMHRAALEGTFSIIGFYVRRTRRIVPLVLVAGAVSLGIGLWVMLPDDLENLAQSVLATNFFANNFLLLITSRDYWAAVNEYKPLVHTWSLGIEEQFYLLIPALYVLLKKERTKYALPVLVVVSLASILLFVFANDPNERFYLLPYRFFELGLGGIVAVASHGGLAKARRGFGLYLGLLILLLVDLPLHDSLRQMAVAGITGLMLGVETCGDRITQAVFENAVVVWIGKISFSLYIWHQVLLALGRYFVVEQFHHFEVIVFVSILVAVSSVSYYAIEQPFQNANVVAGKRLLAFTGGLFTLTTAVAVYLYAVAGVVRPVPELGIEVLGRLQRIGDRTRNVHIEYNAKIFDLDKPFRTRGSTVKMLVVGNSFARDFANILLESRYANRLEVSYCPVPTLAAGIDPRFCEADIICFSEATLESVRSLSTRQHFSMEKVWNVGTKYFGNNNGIFYNQPRDENFYLQRTRIIPRFLELNTELKKQWQEKYIDLIALVVDEKGKVPIFTSDQKFFSHDGLHLTAAGAEEFARRLDLGAVFSLN